MDIQKNIILAPYTTVKIGGPADFFIHTKTTDEFVEALQYGQKNNLPITILGNGSNVLISDSGIRGLVIKNDSEEMEIMDQDKVRVSSGTQLSSLINYSLDHHLLGLEEFAYIPSTVGGAIIGDIHGINKNHFSQFIDSLEKFGDFIVCAVLKLTPGDPSLAQKQVQDIIQKKSAIQPMNSLGCVFKNIPNQLPTGQIIDQQLNLKGFSIGDAQISSSHANFIVNNGHATATDYFKLIQLIQSQAKEKLGITLKLEIKLLGEF
ncbi:MAG TPA: FAD-binding protein [Candidatus Woesebacteria bacterium]|mgnify:CR=1 FL=1|nr:FAD-binding protein [Candidatus Woesebacteria bacterium]